MNYNEFNEYITEDLKIIGLRPDEDKKIKLYEFMNMVLEKNKVLNLTSITDVNDFIKKHIIDSLCVVPYINSTKSIIDIGTGAGFPGVPIKIIYPEMNVTLLDSVNKKMTFLRESVKELGLNKIECICGRAEDAGHDIGLRGKYDFSIARAVAKLPVLLEYCVPFLKTSGIFIAMKTGMVSEELESCKNALISLNISLFKNVLFYLPQSDISRSIILFQLTGDVPKKYPRKAGVPVKKPL